MQIGVAQLHAKVLAERMLDRRAARPGVSFGAERLLRTQDALARIACPYASRQGPGHLPEHRRIRPMGQDGSGQATAIANPARVASHKTGALSMPSQAAAHGWRPFSERYQELALSGRMFRPGKKRQGQAGREVERIGKKSTLGLGFPLAGVGQQSLILVCRSDVVLARETVRIKTVLDPAVASNSPSMLARLGYHNPDNVLLAPIMAFWAY